MERIHLDTACLESKGQRKFEDQLQLTIFGKMAQDDDSFIFQIAGPDVLYTANKKYLLLVHGIHTCIQLTGVGVLRKSRYSRNMPANSFREIKDMAKQQKTREMPKKVQKPTGTNPSVNQGDCIKSRQGQL